MDEDEVAWPTGMSGHDPAARERPLVFNPQGSLVAILDDAIELYFGSARQGCSALWVHVPIRHHGRDRQDDLHRDRASPQHWMCGSSPIQPGRWSGRLPSPGAGEDPC